MPPRKKSDTVALKLRMKEPLRAKIERAAKKNGVSMNTEITTRLSASLETEAALYESFGGEENFLTMRTLAGIINVTEMITQKSWVDDPHTKDTVRYLADAYFRQVGVEVPFARALSDVTRERQKEADAVLRDFMARAPQEPKPALAQVFATRPYTR